MAIYVFEISEVFYLFIKLLVLDKNRDFSQNFLKVFLKEKTFDLTHFLSNFLYFDIKLLHIYVNVMSRVLNC